MNGDSKRQGKEVQWTLKRYTCGVTRWPLSDQRREKTRGAKANLDEKEVEIVTDQKEGGERQRKETEKDQEVMMVGKKADLLF